MKRIVEIAEKTKQNSFTSARMSRHVLIGGGSGFIGQAITRQLRQRGDRVTWISRTPGSFKIFRHSCQYLPVSQETNTRIMFSLWVVCVILFFQGTVCFSFHQTFQWSSWLMWLHLGRETITWGDLARAGLQEEYSAVINLAGQHILDPRRKWNSSYRFPYTQSCYPHLHSLRDSLQALIVRLRLSSDLCSILSWSSFMQRRGTSFSSRYNTTTRRRDQQQGR